MTKSVSLSKIFSRCESRNGSRLLMYTFYNCKAFSVEVSEGVAEAVWF